MTEQLPEGMTTRKLRLWHWNRCMLARRTAQTATFPHEFKRATKWADFHIGCVLALNDCSDCRDTTAEQDAELFPAFRTLKRNRP